MKDFLRETFLTRTRDEWVQFFDGVNASVAPVNTLREAADDPQLRHRHMIVEDERGWEHIGIPMKFREEPGELRLEFAELGQHSAEILARLGYDEATINTMKQDGVF